MYWRASLGLAYPTQEHIISRLISAMKEDRLSPDHSCIVSIPKRTGLLRHMSILSLGDHLVYQAIMNVIAEKVEKKLGKHYHTSLFGNRFAGKESAYFYRKWQVAYQEYGTRCRAIHGQGYDWVATFDFASYYDSIDHAMLDRILRDVFKVQPKLLGVLKAHLARWTSANDGETQMTRMYLGHGIPQGPIPSAMLAEAPLWYLDEKMLKMRETIYVRYADDVKIFGKTEESVRFAAAVFDRLSRNIGLFPQAKKVDISKVEDVNELIKSVSWQIEDELDEEAEAAVLTLDESLSSSATVRFILDALAKLRHLDADDQVNITAFTFALGGIPPSDRIAHEVAKTLRFRPDLSDPLFRYLNRCSKLGLRTISELLGLASSSRQYAFVVTRCLVLLGSRLAEVKGSNRQKLKSIVKLAMGRRGTLTDCMLDSVARRLAVVLKVANTSEIESWLTAPETAWVSKVDFILNVDQDAYGGHALRGVLGELCSDPVPEVCRVAAHRLALIGVNASGKESEDARLLLEAHGLGQTKPPKGYTRIEHALNSLLDSFDIKHRVMGVDFSAMCGNEASVVERYLVLLRSYQTSDKTQFVCELDAALDVLLSKVVLIARYTFTNKKGKQSACSTRNQLIRQSADFREDYPLLQAFASTVNSLRHRCDTAHPYFTAGGGRVLNRRIWYDEIVQVLRRMPDAINELARDWPKR
jgi:hypothetical protein